MPRTTVYIRNEDWEKWKILPNKSEIISKAINKESINIQVPNKIYTYQEIVAEKKDKEDGLHYEPME